MIDNQDFEEHQEARLLTITEVSERLKISPRTILRMVKNATIPKPLRLGKKCIRWRESDIEDWIASGCQSRLDDAA